MAAICPGLTPREKAAVRTCLGGSARMMEKVVRKAKVCATCHIDVKSGLPEFPIGGQLKFTQPVTNSSVVRKGWGGGLAASGCINNIIVSG